MKVLIYSTRGFERDFLTKANNNKHQLYFTNSSLNSETVSEAKDFDAISIFSADIANKEVLDQLNSFGVQYITLRSTGFDNVAIEEAKELGIKVANVPSYSPNAIAEHAVSLLLAINRNLIESNNRVQQYNFDLNGLKGFDLNNKTIGIIGTGNIGAIMCKIMNGFGCKILGFDKNPNTTLSNKYNLSYVSLEELCKTSDIISIHLPLNKHTHYLINKNLIKLMKPSVIIINTGRGGIINTADIISVLEKNRIKALGTDVYEYEKGVFFKDLSKKAPNDPMLKKLLKMPNVLLTGHHAFLTDEALTNIADATIENLSAFEQNQKLPNELTS